MSAQPASAEVREKGRVPLIQRVFRALSYRDFRLMWLGACTSTIGTFVQQFAQSYMVYDITKDYFYSALDVFLGQLPIVMFSLIGGVFADRTDRRKLLLMSQYIQMTSALTLMLLFHFGVVKVWHILTLSFVAGLGQSFGGPAYSALLPTLVEPQDLNNAVAMNSIQFNLARILGPAIGGAAFAALGAQWCFGLNGLSFIAVIISLYSINVRFVPPKSTERIIDSMKEGFRFIHAREGMQQLIVLSFLMTALGFPLTVFLPGFVHDIFQKGPETLALLMACSGAGSLTGGLIVAAVGKLKRQGQTSLIIVTVLGALIAAFALSRWLPLSCFLIFAIGASIMSSASLLLTLAQLSVGDEMRGRVMSVFNLSFRSGMPVGGLMLGKFNAAFGVSVTLASSGSILVAVALYFLLMHRRVAEL
ncbi:MAG: MFS transporter [Bryobacterales bacterium]|nr:MFS transporter [Bryobacterales bacterium]MBV9397444.1 MFS transporter [Bryobacterales bacterium]